MKKLKLIIHTKEDFTDSSIIEYLNANNNFTAKEYSEFLFSKDLFNEFAKNLVSFISSYDNGFFRPTKCDAYEPIEELFNENDLSQPISWLSQPGGAFYFKQTIPPRIEGAIENNRFAPIWEGKTAVKLLRPKVAEPVYKGEIKLFFDSKVVTLKGIHYWVQFINQLCQIVNASTGQLSLQNEEETYAHEIDEKKIMITKGAKEIFLTDTIAIK